MIKKYIYILFVFFAVPAFAQIDDTELDEIYIDKMTRSQIEQVIIKVREQTYKNYIETTDLYTISHQAILGDSFTLINSKEDF